MARFYGTLQGRSGGVKTAVDPQQVTLNGWDAGVMVTTAGAGTRRDPVDAFEVYMTFGSNAHGSPVKIGTVYHTADGPQFVAEEDAVTGDAYTEHG